jgi:DNA primase
MISSVDKLKVIGVLDSSLGIGSRLKSDEQAYYCPFCHHHKKKLQVNLETQKWHCWVCDSKGLKIRNLLRKLDIPKSSISLVDKIYGNSYVKREEKEEIVDLRLPNDFKPLRNVPNSFEPNFKHALLYLKRRGLTPEDIIKYNIGYCTNGLYSNRIIVPSYDDNYRLNYFIARSFYEDSSMKYKNPPVSKNTIIFENQINWNLPIIICEGVFDAIAIKRNAIPILGKFIPKKLMNRIFKERVNEITIALDSDAQEQALHYVNYFQKQGILVKNIKPTDKDVSDMGFFEINKNLKAENNIEFIDLVRQKIKNI